MKYIRFYEISHVIFSEKERMFRLYVEYEKIRICEM